MKKLLLGAILAATATALACSDGSKETKQPSGGPTVVGGGKKTAIHFTKNLQLEPGYGPPQYPAPCIGIVSTEHVFGDKADVITWKIKKNGGEGGGDDCEADLGKVNVRFDNPNAVSPNPAYAGNNGKADEIEVTVSSNEAHYNGSKHQKYRVWFDDTNVAGPDPIIIVNCGSCGPGGGGPGRGGSDPDPR